MSSGGRVKNNLNWCMYLMCLYCFTELRSISVSEAQKQSIRGKLTTLGTTYSGSERFFPVEYIVQLLEQHSCNRGWGVEFVYEVMLEIGVSVRALFAIYDKMFKAKVRMVAHGRSFHVQSRPLPMNHCMMSMNV